MIRSACHDGICTVTIDRPEKAGALTRQMLSDMADAVEQNDTAQALILTGTGAVFSAGADLKDVHNGLATDPVWERLSSAIAAFPGLSIAALNGTLAGGAFGMVAACDIRIAVPEARFFYPVMKHGVLPPPSDPPRLKALIGPARTKMILMAGRKISADTALAWGLIDQICPQDTLIDNARELCHDVVNTTAEHAAQIKSLI